LEWKPYAFHIVSVENELLCTISRRVYSVISHVFGTKKVMFWAFFDEKDDLSYYCESRFWHRDPGSEVFLNRNPGSEKERRDCNP
jgi:hypothetical protein